MVGAYGGHGGGDERLAADFVQFVRGEKPSLACTSIFDSVAGHCVYIWQTKVAPTAASR